MALEQDNFEIASMAEVDPHFRPPLKIESDAAAGRHGVALVQGILEPKVGDKGRGQGETDEEGADNVQDNPRPLQMRRPGVLRVFLGAVGEKQNI